MSTITCFDSFTVDNLTAEICRETFRNGKQRFVVYFWDGDFEYTEGVAKTEADARVWYDKLVEDLKAGWKP